MVSHIGFFYLFDIKWYKDFISVHLPVNIFQTSAVKLVNTHGMINNYYDFGQTGFEAIKV